MKDPLVQTLKESIEKHLPGGGHFLLGLSGGVDSLALLFLLKECQRFFSYTLCIAHFDHGWREESIEEAQKLSLLAEELNIPFYTERDQAPPEKDLENQARKRRYAFFQRVYETVQADALFLGHQREDLAQTVLKRVLEGASLTSLAGMEEVSSFASMSLIRPLLFTSRDELIRFNKEKGLTPFIDHTNEEERFLRPRMAKYIFPDLEKWFGKGVEKPLALFAKEAASLKHYIERKVEPFLLKEERGRFGAFLPLEKEIDPFEKKQAIRSFFKRRGVSFAKEALPSSEGGEKQLDISSGQGFVSPYGVLHLNESLPSFQEEGWHWKFSSATEGKSTSLRECFLEGEVHLYIPKGAEFVSFEKLSVSQKKQVSSFFSCNKVPVRLRKIFPVAIKGGELIDLTLLFFLKQKKKESFEFVKINLENSQN